MTKLHNSTLFDPPDLTTMQMKKNADILPDNELPDSWKKAHKVSKLIVGDKAIAVKG